MGNSNIKYPSLEGLWKGAQPQKVPEIEYEREKERDKAAVAAEKQNFLDIHKHNKEGKDSELIENCLLNHYFLRALEKQSRLEIIKEMTRCTIKEGTEIFKQNADPGHFFIISSGTVELIVEGLPTVTVNSGGCFGEKSLIYGTCRTCTAKAKTECIVWIMEKRNFKKVIEHIIHITFEDNNKSTQSIPIFSTLEHEAKVKILNSLYRETQFENQKICRRNDISNAIYLVKDGEITLNGPDRPVGKVVKGEHFGVLSVILGTGRVLEPIPKTKSHIYSVPVSVIKRVCGKNYREMILLSIVKAAFLKSNKFSKLNMKLIDDFFYLFKVYFYEKETTIVSKGNSKSQDLIIPICGDLFEDGGKTICKKGNLLCGDEVYDQAKGNFDKNIKCTPYSLVLKAKASEILKIFNCSFREMADKSSAIEQLKKVALFKNFTNAKLENLSKKIKSQKLKDGENVITQGEEGTRFYIVKKGMVDIFVKDKYIRTMNENEYLGERALFFKEPRSATAKAHGDCEVFYLEKEDFETVIEKNLKEYLIGRLYLQDNTVQLNDLTYYMNLGSGSYGNVSLVKSKKNNYFYAIKNISLKQIKYGQLHTNLELERSILLKIDHPFIVKLVKTMKDEKYVYFLMDYIKGKELFDVIREIGLLNKTQTQFYGGSMMLAVQYLHERKFVFRDIKPENIMVLDNGFIKVIDFGTAKQISEKTTTIIGTPHYMAPEVIMGEGYSFQVDFWSIAICMYEFMCGAVPFGETAEEPMDVYLAIIHDNLGFPSFVKDRDFKNLMQLMLNKSLNNRYSKLSQISSHIWFQSFNWDELISLNMKPAYIPKVESREEKYNPRPYVNYIQSLKDWEVPENQQPLTQKNIQEFNDWLKKF